MANGSSSRRSTPAASRTSGAGPPRASRSPTRTAAAASGSAREMPTMNARNPVVGLVTIGQAPRLDVVPEMTAAIGAGIEVREAGALDGLTSPEIEALRPSGQDEILVTRLRDGSAVFLGKEKIVGLVERRIATLEREGAAL